MNDGLNMKMNEVVNFLVKETNIDNYETMATSIAILLSKLSKSHADQLRQLVNKGPVWDGNVDSKSDRNDLIDMGLAVRVCVNGELGYTGGTYFALAVVQALADM